MTCWRHVCADADLAFNVYKTHLEFHILKLLLTHLQTDVHLVRASCCDLCAPYKKKKSSVVLFPAALLMFNQRLLTSAAPKKKKKRKLPYFLIKWNEQQHSSGSSFPLIVDFQATIGTQLSFRFWRKLSLLTINETVFWTAVVCSHWTEFDTFRVNYRLLIDDYPRRRPVDRILAAFALRQLLVKLNWIHSVFPTDAWQQLRV